MNLLNQILTPLLLSTPTHEIRTYMWVGGLVFVSIAYIVQTPVEEYVYTTADLLTCIRSESYIYNPADVVRNER